MIKYKNNINVGTGSVGYEADATSAAPADTVSGGKIVKSEGRTVKWNQLVQNGNFSDSTIWEANSSTTRSISNNTLTASGTVSSYIQVYSNSHVHTCVSGHKYFLRAFVTCPNRTIIALNTTTSKGKAEIASAASGEWCKSITTCSDTFDLIPTIRFLTATYGVEETVIGSVKNFTIYNLTSIFGEGNEPATVEAFESWLAENMVEQYYYAYDAGSLVPVTVKGVKRNVGGTTVTNPMPVTTLKDDNDVVMFPDGLKSAGSVKDEIDWEHGVAVKRVGVVDLGDLTWEYNNTNFKAVLTDAYNYVQTVGAISSNYPFKGTVISRASATVDKNLYFYYNATFIPSDANKIVYIADSDYTDATAFKTAVTGQKLYYELATPITYHFATHTELKKRVVKIGESVEVDGIEGETVKWNQLVVNGDFSNGISRWEVRQGNSAVLSTSDGLELVGVSGTSNYSQIRTQDKNFVGGHKYYLTATVKKNDCPITTITVYQVNGWSGSQTTKLQIEPSQTYTKAGIIITAVDGYEYLSLIASGIVNDDDNRWYVKDVQVINLTSIFGSGNEPATVAEFEAWLSAHGGIKDYYPYCAGELKDKEEGTVRGVGFNLWDEEWESGYLDNSGVKKVDATSIRSKNFTSVIAGQSYYFKVPQGAVRICWYTSAKVFISKSSAISNNTQSAPNNAAYLLFYTTTTYGTTYNHDICINLSDASRNGTYVPYKSITRSVDLTTLKGKVDGAGEDVVMFPDGMKQAGSVKDEIYVEGGVVKAVKRVGTVDLGELTWVRVDDGCFYADLQSKHSGINLICSKYQTYNENFGWNTAPDKSIGSADNQRVYCKDSAYTSASDFTTAMQGVMLNYELASPVTYVVNMQGMEMAEVKKVMMGAQKVWEIQ